MCSIQRTSIWSFRIHNWKNIPLVLLEMLIIRKKETEGVQKGKKERVGNDDQLIRAINTTVKWWSRIIMRLTAITKCCSNCVPFFFTFIGFTFYFLAFLKYDKCNVIEWNGWSASAESYANDRGKTSGIFFDRFVLMPRGDRRVTLTMIDDD